jgi:hypothetical protein
VAGDELDYEVTWHGAMWRRDDDSAEGEAMGQQYQFKDRKGRGGVSGLMARPKAGADPQQIGERLEHIIRRRGRLTPQVVVEDATPVGSPLHHYFEWNDGKAANSFRVLQAREIIASVYIVQPSAVSEEPVVARAFVSVDTNADAHYEPIATVLSDAAMYAQVCRRAHAELVSFQERFADFFALKQIGARAAEAVEKELATAEERTEQIA